MASSVHPFQGYQGNGANNNRPPPGYGNPTPIYGGYTAGYGGGASTGAPGSAGYPSYGAPPPNAGYSFGAPQPNAAYGGAPPGNQGYTMSTPGIGYSMDALGNIDVPMSVPGNQAYGYGAPNPVGYIGGGAPGAYPVGGAPPGYPAYTPPPGTAGYPYGALSPGTAYPAVVYPGGGGAPGGYMGLKGGQSPSQQPADPRNQIQTGRWAAGLCACCDDCVPNLCMPWCCPCVSLAQIYARMGMQGYKPAVARFFLLYVVGLQRVILHYGLDRRQHGDLVHGDAHTHNGDSSGANALPRAHLARALQDPPALSHPGQRLQRLLRFLLLFMLYNRATRDPREELHAGKLRLWRSRRASGIYALIGEGAFDCAVVPSSSLGIQRFQALKSISSRV